ARRGRGTVAEGRPRMHRCASTGGGLPRSAERLDGRTGGGPYLVPCPGPGSRQRFPSGGGRRGTDRYRESLFEISKESGALVDWCASRVLRNENRLQYLWAGLGRNAKIGKHTSELQSRGHLVCRLLLE